MVALNIYRKGHIPVIGEWLEEFLYPVAHRLISRCDAILRIPGESRGADLDVEEGKKRGLTIYSHLDEIPAL
mgnify:CR=1 FL=1